MKHLIKSIAGVTAAVVGSLAVVGCENSTAPHSGRMTTDADHGLIVKSDSPSVNRNLGIRAGSTIPRPSGAGLPSNLDENARAQRSGAVAVNRRPSTISRRST